MTIRNDDVEAVGWTLNVSRGGIRAVMEEELDANAEYLVIVGEAPPRRARVAWARSESDGQIVGIRFLDADGSVPPDAPNDPPPPGRTG